MRYALALMLGMGLTTAVSAQTCSKQTITGTYGLLCSSVGAAPAAIAIVGKVTVGQNIGISADFIGTGTINLSGGALNQSFSGRSTINPDCTGTVGLSGGILGTLQIAYHVVDGGNEIRGISLDGYILTCSLRLISR